jgi:hypothetical protein
MAIGKFPFYNRPLPGGTSARTLTNSAAPFSVVVAETAGSDANPDDVTPSTSANQTLVVGVISDPQGDPNNSGNFPSGAVVNVMEHGKCPVLIVSGAVLTKRCTIVTSSTPGMATVLGVDPPAAAYDVIGYYDDVPQTLAANTPLSVELCIHRVELPHT